MAVIVDNLQTGSTPPVTRFSDTLRGADRPVYIGNDWFLNITQSTAVSGSDVAARLNIGATGMTVGNGDGVNNSNINLLAFPALVSRRAVVTKSAGNGIFSQMVLVARTNPGIQSTVGPAVGLNPGDCANYSLQLNSANNNTVLFRMNTAGTYTALVANVFSSSPGDIVRLEYRIVGGFPELRSYQNGILRNTTVDNSGLGPTAGQFGMIIYGTFSGIITISDYSGGVL